MIKVSIIVPVYNTSKYLHKCLDSLVNQTISDIEIIVVNDGSTDNSMDIINEYKKKYNQIKVIDKLNGGVSTARNEGVKIATGIYIGFVDSDDYVDINMYKKLYDTSIIGDYDIVVSDLFVVNNNKNKRMISGLRKSLKNKNSIRENMNNVNSTLCNKIYKTSILKDNLFTIGMEYEDVEFLYRLFPKINNIGVVFEPLYFYNNRDDSKTHTYSENWYKLLENLDVIIKYYKDNNIYNNYKSELEYMYIKYTFGTFFKKISKCNNLEIFKKAYEFAISNLNSKYPNYKKNIYLNKISIKNLYFKYLEIFNVKFIYKILSKYM